MECLVVFHGRGRHPLSFLLKEGFKHCFIAVKTNGCWVEIDALMGTPLIRILTQDDFPLKQFYEEQGFRVVETTQVHNEISPWNFIRSRIILANCVGMVKAILGLNGLIFSPYSLYKRLKT